MQFNNPYDYTIKIADIAETIRKAKSAGYTALIYINGEYYDINLGEKKEGKKNV